MGGYIFGAHILESLTTGMYQDSRMIFREYIQNSCDSIDKAVRAGLLDEEEGRIDITLDTQARAITITDNGTGIKSSDFVRILGNIADSDKKLGEERGFRGIGRLCGLAYCSKLTFKAKYRGEVSASVLVCDAEIMRSLLNENSEGTRSTASEVLEAINEFSVVPDEDKEAHYFMVELEGISTVNKVLLDYDEVSGYLSFTAPLPYDITFIPFSKEIYTHAKELGHKIDEYAIFLNGDQLFKAYSSRFRAGKGKSEDEIFDLMFMDFRDSEDNLIAWLWTGVSCFRGAISEKCRMRGIRLRKDNLQVGNEHTLQGFFKETRGINYFIGELFCVSKDLIPNSQRDYFNENSTRAELENQLRIYFYDVLYALYAGASEVRSSLKRIAQSKEKKAELTDKLTRGIYSDEAHRTKLIEEIQRAESEALRAQTSLDRLKSKDPTMSEIAGRIETSTSYSQEPQQDDTGQTSSKYTQHEQAMLRKIFAVLSESFTKEISDTLIRKIEAVLK